MLTLFDSIAYYYADFRDSSSTLPFSQVLRVSYQHFCLYSALPLQCVPLTMWGLLSYYTCTTKMTELIWFGCQTSLIDCCQLTVPSRLTQWSFSWPMLSMSSMCFYQLHRLRQLKHHRCHEAAFICRLDYYNAIRSGLPLATIVPLHWVHNAPHVRSPNQSERDARQRRKQQQQRNRENREER